jgi:sucrose-phosphate synthase
LRVLFLNPQGNFDKQNSFLGKHPDFGGQLVYVMELAKAMAKQNVKADILTRQIKDRNWPGYDKEVEEHLKGRLRIIRIPFGGKKFLRKEDLWKHLHEYVKGIIEFYKKDDTFFSFITSHYGDGGISAALLSRKTNIPYSFTAHSLGAQKLRTLNVNINNIDDLNYKYNLATRIVAERIAMANSSFNVTSTHQERFEQYGHSIYNNVVDVYNEKKFYVIPPGVNTKIFNLRSIPYERKFVLKIKAIIERDISPERRNFPFIIASSRIDHKKNHLGLIDAYIMNKGLQEKANLIIQVKGVNNAFNNYKNLKSESKEILNEIFYRIKTYNLKGKICFINLNTQRHISVCYRYLVTLKSVFCLTAHHEPFGIAPLEAMACGLPAVVTQVGGPKEVLVDKDESFGLLINPSNNEDIGNKLYEIISNKDIWEYYHNQGIKRVLARYTWEMSAKYHIEIINQKLNEKRKPQDSVFIPPYFISGHDKDMPPIENLEELYFYKTNLYTLKNNVD